MENKTKKVDVLTHGAELGDIITVQVKNMWGEKTAYSFEHICTGIRGTYPDYTYRFTRIGVGSIAKNEYQDIEFKAQEYHEGFDNLFSVLQKIVRNKVEKVGE
jgi:hypothetical protein